MQLSMKTLSTLSSATEAINKLTIEAARNEESPLEDPAWTTIHTRKHKPVVKHAAQTVKTDKQRTHLALGRTSSAPVGIPNRKHWRHHSDKKQLTRVSSVTDGISPGGKHRLMYDRDFLLDCRQSPLSLTPPNDLPVIPGATAPTKRRPRKKRLEKVDSNVSSTSAASYLSSATDDEQTQTTQNLLPA